MSDSVKFNVTAGMTASDVVQSSQATAEQKAVAAIFENFDGKAGFSEYEARAFNEAVIEKKHGNRYSVWTTNKAGKEKEIQYKQGKYIELKDYRNEKFASRYTKFVWNKKTNDWELKDDCYYNEKGFFESTYWAKYIGKSKRVIETTYQGACVPKIQNTTKYDENSDIKSFRHEEFNSKGKRIEFYTTK